MSSKAILRLYRAMLKTGRALEGSIERRGMNAEQKYHELCRFELPVEMSQIEKSKLVDRDVGGYLVAIVRKQFQIHAKYRDPEDLSDLMSVGFRALRQANDRREQLDDPSWKPRAEEVAFKIGEVLEHTKHGYRCTVFGWDHVCKANNEWVRLSNIDELSQGKAQAFYHVLVCNEATLFDEDIKYVPQENLVPVRVNEGEACEAICHPAVPHYFSSFNPREAKYMPSEELRKLYPED